MTTFKPGDRVHVEFDATITSLAAEGWWPVVLLEGVQPETRIQIAPEFFTLIRAPLRVGDVLTADDPEPPDHTIVINSNHWPVLHAADGWLSAGSAEVRRWAEFIRINAPVTVLYVPEDTP